MIIGQGLYDEPDIIDKLADALQIILSDRSQPPLFLCIGSDRHILDSFGPLTGSLLKDKMPYLNVYGTLAEPLHARNLVSRLDYIYALHPAHLEIAIDASVGNDNELGFIRLRQGALLPGKALSRRLPPIGHLSITGVVGTRAQKQHLRSNTGSLGPVYGMAWAVSEAVWKWHNSSWYN
jgi:putative sporulation protein YyaC